MNGDWLWLLAPWAAGLLVLASHVPLGREVLRRGIVFVDLAVAQLAGLGVIAAHAWGWAAEDPAGSLTGAWAVQTAALGFALLGAGLLVWIERRWPEVQEAMIGALFVVAASLAALVSAHDPHGGEHLRDLLVGQLLWAGWAQLGPALGISLAALGLWFAFRTRAWAFPVALALCVTVSVQLVGVWLVFASLILPALAVRRLDGPRGLAVGLSLGALAYGLGLALSATQDWPAGAVVVVALALVAALVAALSGRSEKL